MNFKSILKIAAHGSFIININIEIAVSRPVTRVRAQVSARARIISYFSITPPPKDLSRRLGRK